MTAQNLTQMAQQIRGEYASLRTRVLLAEQISLTENGLLDTGEDRFALTRHASAQFARWSRIPSDFYLGLDPDLQARIFNRLFVRRIGEGRIWRELRLTINKDNEAVGWDDPHLLRPEQRLTFPRSSRHDYLQTSVQKPQSGTVAASTNLFSTSENVFS